MRAAFILPPVPCTVLVDRPVGVPRIGDRATMLPLAWPAKDAADTVTYGLDFSLALGLDAYGPVVPVIVIADDPPFSTPKRHRCWHKPPPPEKLHIIQAAASVSGDSALKAANCQWAGPYVTVTLTGGTPTQIITTPVPPSVPPYSCVDPLAWPPPGLPVVDIDLSIASVTVIVVLSNGERLRRVVSLAILPTALPAPITAGWLTINGLPITIGGNPIVLGGQIGAMQIGGQVVTIGGVPIFLR